MHTQKMSLVRSIHSLSPRVKIAAGLLVAVLVVLIGWHVATGAKSAADTAGAMQKTVTVSSAAALSSGGGSITLTGTVTSMHEATLRAQTSGGLTQVYKKLGDTVGAGEVIAEFDNSAERAAVLQAQGAYEAALAGSSIADVSRDQSGTTVANSRIAAYNALRSAYATADDAIRTKTDGVFSNPRSAQPLFVLSSSNTQMVIDLQTKRPQLEDMLTRESNHNAGLESLSDTALLAEINQQVSDLQTTASYLDTLSLALNQSFANNAYSQTTIDGYKASVSVARSAVTGSLSALAGVKASYDAALSGAAIATHQSASGTNAPTTASASVKQALGALRGAQSRLEDTIVRSPISGSIISLPVSMGDYVGMGSPVAVVSNNNALEIVTYVNEDDARTIAVGGVAHIEGTTAGVIMRIAPALDPLTKKIEVRVGIQGNASALTNGSTVRVELERSHADASAGGAAMVLPIAAVKILPDGAAVFTVNASSTLESHIVQLGALMGDRVNIAGGITPNLQIVTDARGLKAGDAVQIQDKN